VNPISGWPTFSAAGIGCSPAYIDWSQLGTTIYVKDVSIVPGGQYHVESVLLGCDPGVSSHLSAPLNLNTSPYGDLVGNCASNPCSPANGFVENIDMTAVLDKFRNVLGAPTKARSDLEPAGLDNLITISDVVRVLEGFVGDDYPYNAPAPCP